MSKSDERVLETSSLSGKWLTTVKKLVRWHLGIQDKSDELEWVLRKGEVIVRKKVKEK